MTKEFVLEFKELRFISVECGTCHSEMTIDAANQQSDDFPIQCPCCHAEFTAFLKSRIKNFKDAYRVLSDASSPRVKVRIRVDEGGSLPH